MKITKNKIIKYIIVLIGLIVLYLVLMYLSVLIPRKMIEKNIRKSVDAPIFLDSFTDNVMLDMALRNNPKHLIDSILQNNVLAIKEGIDDHDGYNPRDALKIDVLNLKDNNYKYSYSYGRFWNGFLVYLKPLLILFDYKSIVLLQGILFLLSSIAFSILLFRKIDKKLAGIIIFAIISAGYLYLWVNMTTFITIFLSIIFSIIILLYYEKIKDIYLLFLINGSLTAFLCYMTFTPLTLFLPLIIYYSLDSDYSLKKLFKIFIAYCFGYLGTWGIKWIILISVYGSDGINNIFNAVKFRVGYDVKSIYEANPIISIVINCYYMIIPFIIECGIILIMMINKCINKEVKINIKDKKNIVFLIIMVIPFLRYMLIVNHSVIHAWLYTHRLLMITQISMYIIIDNILSCDNKKGKMINDKKTN